MESSNWKVSVPVVPCRPAYSRCDPWLVPVKSYLERNVELVRNALRNIPRVKLVEPEGTFLLWVAFNRLGLELDELYTFLRDKVQWSVTRGHSFGKKRNGLARVNIACTRAKLETAHANLEHAVIKLHPDAHRVRGLLYLLRWPTDLNGYAVLEFCACIVFRGFPSKKQ